MRQMRPDIAGTLLLIGLLVGPGGVDAQKGGRLSRTQKELQEVQRELAAERRRAQEAGRREGVPR